MKCKYNGIRLYLRVVLVSIFWHFYQCR